uniref:Coproporphyrinogen-III oxidase n=1 Tax=Roseihalotalea indica TaxID=2867963 RepID=A0AA49JFF4_9BACT|nr:oxygen-independent coproporphyrinogen III oxidase [Tunicatimonas sp. TK19036]
MNTSLIRKYNVPGPRYTSYPTVPYWNKTPSQQQWQLHVKQAYQESQQQGISLYIHLPYCESLCTYCGCNTHITVNHNVEHAYIDALLKEWSMYVHILEDYPLIQEIHLGGGTPTFFSPPQLQRLLQGIRMAARINDTAELSLEAHPNNTSPEHLTTLYQLGFRRLSLGIQDFDHEVQKQINRIQSYEQVEKITTLAREIGYQSINYDLIFGLPRQTVNTISQTIQQTLRLQPDRIAFYSYAHVPWMKPAQKSFEAYLPTDKEKRSLYETGKQLLEQGGYYEIGMDHFALPTDKLFLASQQSYLHRNFMGYTTQTTRLMLGLGTSAISDSWSAFAQNEKTTKSYLQAIRQGMLPVERGHILTEEDLLIREHILNLMCQGKTCWDDCLAENRVLNHSLERLEAMEEDHLVNLGSNFIHVTEEGKPFIRNICMALDTHLRKSKPSSSLFSTTI